MPRVYFVDRDAAIKERLDKALCPHEFDVTMFSSPTEALSAFSPLKPDLLISGIHLQEMSGFDLAEAAREIAAGLPVILVADDPSPLDISRAAAFGIKHVLANRGENTDDLLQAIRSELAWNCAQDTVRELDEIRMEFYTELSHKLRTPVTAMKLAVEGLFQHLLGVLNPSQRELANVNRRNIERVVSLVENQLDLLQFMMGESRIYRRLVDVNELLKDISKRLIVGGHSPGVEPVEIRSSTTADGPLYVFTDPAPLATIIECLLGGGPPNVRRVVNTSYDKSEQRCQIEIGLDFLNADCCGKSHGAGSGGLEDDCSMNRFDFEYRAYKSLLAQLDGEVILEKNANHKRVRITLPRYPGYDRAKDFLTPLRVVRAAAEESGRSVSLLRCDLDPGLDEDYLDAGNDTSHGLLTRIEAVVSDGDFILRGGRPKTVYLALTGRTPSELDHVKAYLNGREVHGEDDSELYVSRPQTNVEDHCQIIGLTGDLEPA